MFCGMDNLTSHQRSYCMSRIRSKDTSPEIIVRRLSHRMGYRFRLHRSDRPGRPDLTFPKLKKVIFVHGCFWHSHNCRRGTVKPKTNATYWKAKRERTLNRDKKNLKNIESLGWQSLVIWECEVNELLHLEEKISDFFNSRNLEAND